MAVSVKLKKLRTTIVSNCFIVLLLFFNTSFAQNNSVIEINENGEVEYIIQIVQISENKVNDERKAALRAKSKLLRFFKAKDPNVKGLNLSHFTLIKNFKKGKSNYFVFSIPADNVKPY